MSYQHLGQHSLASPELVRELRPATPAERAELLAELRSIGYHLRIEKTPRGRRRSPTPHTSGSSRQHNRHSRQHNRHNHSTKKNSDYPLLAIEIDRSEFESRANLPMNARWRDDLVHLAEKELSQGRTYRRPRDASYTVIEWTGPHGALGRLLDWLEETAGITRYAEVLE